MSVDPRRFGRVQQWQADFKKIGRLVADEGGGYANEATIAQHRHAIDLLKKWLVDGVPR